MADEVVGEVSSCGEGAGGVFGAGGRFLAIQSSKKPFSGVFEAFGAVLGAEAIFLPSSIEVAPTGLLLASEAISGFSAFLALSAALQRSWISFSTSARVLPNLVAE